MGRTKMEVVEYGGRAAETHDIRKKMYNAVSTFPTVREALTRFNLWN